MYDGVKRAATNRIWRARGPAVRGKSTYDAAMAASAKRALVGALLANLAVAATKFLVGTITRSTVMIAEGIHSLVDMGNAMLVADLETAADAVKRELRLANPAVEHVLFDVQPTDHETDR